MQSEWALIHSKHTENMPPQLVVDVCGCWLPKLALTPAGAPCAWLHPSPREHSGSALNTSHRGPHPAQSGCHDALPTLVTSSWDSVCSKGTLHPRWRPDHVRHQHCNTLLFHWQGWGAPCTSCGGFHLCIPSLGCLIQGATWLSSRSAQQSPER